MHCFKRFFLDKAMRNACKYFNSHNYISNYQASTPFYENMRNDFVFSFLVQIW